MTREEYEAMVDKRLKAVKQELMAEYKEEEPSLDEWKEWDEYYYHNAINDIEKGFVTVVDNNGNIGGVDRFRITHGYAKRTSEEVQFQIERDAVLYELSKFAEPKNEVWDGKTNHFYICYSMIENKMSVNYNWINKRDDIYFASREDAEKAVQAVGEERIKKYYLGMEE